MRLEYRQPYRPNWQFADARETSEEVLFNDSMGSIHLADSTGSDEEMETGDAKVSNFQTYED
jgi:hypothetical protein